MNTPRVFVVNEPLMRGFDGEPTRMMDLAPAEEYGRLKFILPAGNPPADMEHLISTLTRGMLDFHPANDFILPVGDMTACMYAVALATTKGKGRFKLLRWSKAGRRYDPVLIDVT